MSSIVWTGRNEYEVHQLVAGDQRCRWDEHQQAYAVIDGSGERFAYPGDRIVKTRTGFTVARA